MPDQEKIPKHATKEEWSALFRKWACEEVAKNRELFIKLGNRGKGRKK